MAYKGTPNQAPNVGLERVNRIINDIGHLSSSEIHLLRYRLNNQFQPQGDSGNPTLARNDDSYSRSNNRSDHRSDHQNVHSLSRREIDVLTLVAAGYSRKEIGASLDITSNTAAKHVSSIYRKLNISSIAEATRIAIENGIVASRAISIF